MVKSLYNNGANSIWEHSLLDPSSIMSGKRKANPQDKVQWVPYIMTFRAKRVSQLKHAHLIIYFSLSPNKTDFIKAKYQMLAFVHRMPCREDDSVTAKDLSKVRILLNKNERTGLDKNLWDENETQTRLIEDLHLMWSSEVLRPKPQIKPWIHSCFFLATSL